MVVVFIAMTGLNLIIWSQRAASLEPQVRMVRRLVHVDSSDGQESPLLRRRIDTLFVGDDARRMIDALNAGKPLPGREVEDS